MNARVKKSIFWGVLIASILLAISIIKNLIGGAAALAHGYGFGGGMRQGGFGHGQMMGGFHHEPSFSWLGILFFVIIAAAVITFVIKLFKKKSQSSSVEHFINTSAMSTPKPSVNVNNASILDEWEKNNTNSKERL
ncbi:MULTISPECIES: hypothetical protein [unclassified Niallia]|uniref:hypothetical protein n=1 Tax=unclassified Niallia TaxID=2837522 RepID=UPI001EDB75A6|nr:MULTISPECIES: hypothetical protein [unclassified Niallia]MCM3033219.1 hypothetical protein [Niallia sp. MER 6]MDL0435445.1 hypothetical protein [Niallia sp. SS-2023]UPO87630.1 hypothetical protein L8T27_019110 [Niallia sp. Man26]